VAILQNYGWKVAIRWQKSAEFSGKSGKKLSDSSSKRGKIRKYKEETSDSSGITSKDKTLPGSLIFSGLSVFMAIAVAILWQIPLRNDLLLIAH